MRTGERAPRCEPWSWKARSEAASSASSNLSLRPQTGNWDCSSPPRSRRLAQLAGVALAAGLGTLSSGCGEGTLHMRRLHRQFRSQAEGVVSQKVPESRG
jgi:hypothetical protein